MVSFDIKSLFMKVPWNPTIDNFKENMWEKWNTSITKNKILCSKNVHCAFESRTSVQTDGVAMGSPLGPVLADIFMMELENSLAPNMTKYIMYWKQYVDDTICFVNIGTTEFIISVLRRKWWNNTIFGYFN